MQFAFLSISANGTEARDQRAVAFLPGAARADDPVPPVAVARHDAALDRDQVAVHLHESEVERRRARPFVAG